MLPLEDFGYAAAASMRGTNNQRRNFFCIFPFYLVRFPFLFVLIFCVNTDTASKANITNQLCL